MDMRRPPRLRRGDEVAVVSTSWGGPRTFPHVYEQGLKTLRERFGLRVREFPTARMPPEQLHGDPGLRAADLNAAFADPDVRAVITSIGGDDSVRILPFLDASAALDNPKILMGFSDTSTQTIFYNLAGLVTFNGPSVMAGFAQMGHFDAAAEHVESVLFGPAPTYSYRPYGEWVDGYRDWKDPANADAVGDVRRHDGWHWLQGSGVASGWLFGGCFDVLEFLKGTSFWPDPGYWSDRILFLETSEETPSARQVGYWLRNYGAQGVFDRISALLIGRARGYTDDEKADLDRVASDVVAGEFGAAGLPIVTNLDFGHTDPQWVLPLGVLAEVDCDRGELTLIEPAVEP